jgi:hypothetical protein
LREVSVPPRRRRITLLKFQCKQIASPIASGVTYHPKAKTRPRIESLTGHDEEITSSLAEVTGPGVA